MDVLDARRRLFEAQRDYARSRYDYLINIVRRIKQRAFQFTNFKFLHHQYPFIVQKKWGRSPCHVGEKSAVEAVELT